MTDAVITDIVMHDGSRHFLSLPESMSSTALVEKVKAATDMRLTQFLETFPESWIDFEFRNHQFTINNQFGEYWFFVADRACPLGILIEIQERFETILLAH